MPQDLVTWFITQGPSGVAILLLLMALIWVVKKWTDDREKHVEQLLAAAEREKEEVRESAKLAHEVKNVLQTLVTQSRG